MIQIKWGKPEKVENKILRLILIISISQICEAIMTIHDFMTVFRISKKNLTSPIMMEPVHL